MKHLIRLIGGLLFVILFTGATWFPLFTAPAVVSPAIDLNFATNSVTGSCASFASCATTVQANTTYVTNSDGTMTSIPPNTLRIGVGTGLLVEVNATNKLGNSQDYTNTGSWPVNGAAITRTAASQTAPDGTNTGVLVADNATTNSNYGVKQTIAGGILASNPYQLWVIIKKKDYRYVQVNFQTGAGPTNRFGYFDLNTCITTGTPSGIVSQYASALTSGWCLIGLSVVSGAGETAAVANITPTDANTTSAHVGVVGQGTYFWGSQVELGTVASSYIPTTTATLRPDDNVSIGGALATLLGQSTGSVVVNTNSSVQSVAGTLIDASGSILLGKTAGNLGTTTVGATLSTANTGTWTGANDLGLGWNGSGGNLQLNGGTVATDGTARTPSATFHIGSTSGSSAFFAGYFTRIRGYSSKLASPQ